MPLNLMDPPFRLQSPSPADRQIAIINLQMLAIEYTPAHMHAGACACEKALQNEVFIVSLGDKERCHFCGNVVHLVAIPHFGEVLAWLRQPAIRPDEKVEVQWIRTETN